MTDTIFEDDKCCRNCLHYDRIRHLCLNRDSVFYTEWHVHETVFCSKWEHPDEQNPKYQSWTEDEQ